MSARGALAWKRAESSISRAGWLTLALERLALAAFITTVLLLGYWYPIPLDWFAQSWTIGSQYQLVTLFNPQFQTIILYPSDIAAAVTVTLWLLGCIAASLTHQERAALRLGPRYLTLPLIGLAALSALSATQAPLPILSLEIALHLLLLAALVIAIINLRPPIWAVTAPLALLLALEGALALSQTLAQSTLLSHWLLNWKHNTTPTQPDASIVQLPDGTRWLRAYGTLPHPNILGGLLCLAIPPVAGAYLRLSHRRSALAWLLLAALALGTLALLLSFSRAAWLGILLGALWAGLLLWQKRRAARKAPEVDIQRNRPARRDWGNPRRRVWWRLAALSRDFNRQGGVAPSPAHEDRLRGKTSLFARHWLRPALLCLLGLGLLVGLVAALGPPLQSRLLLSNSPLEQRSLSERVVLLEASALFFTRHPWLGVGAGNMPLIELAYPPTRNIGEPAHNVPLAVAVETGLFGLLLWLIPPIGALRAAWRRRRALSAAGLIASAALIALLTVAQLDHYLWSQPTGSLIWWLALALAALWSQPESSAAKKP